MSTTKSRINISVSDEIERALFALAKRDQVPNATKAAELLRAAIEIEEDSVLNRIAEERDQKGVRFVSHRSAWR
jgi:predicted DNA-binding protein